MAKKITKKEIASKLSENLGLTKGQAIGYLDELLEVIQDELKQGNDVAFLGFGTLTVRTREEAIKKLKGKEIKVPRHRIVKFRVGKILKETVFEPID